MRTLRPKGEGADYQLSSYLEVIRDFRDSFTVISGLSHPDVGSSHDSIFSFLRKGWNRSPQRGENGQHDKPFELHHRYLQGRRERITLC